METQTLLQNRRFLLALLLCLALVVGSGAAEILSATQPQELAWVSNLAAVFCAFIAAALYSWGWMSMSGSEASRRVWGGVALGMILWTTAEAIWAIYEVGLRVPVPYPSLADAFWLLGYIPLYLALLTRYRTFRGRPSAQQRTVVLLVALLYTVVVPLFVIRPVIDNVGSSEPLRTLTSILYPLADWGLLILTLVIIFALEKGRFAAVWRLFGLGLIMSTTADIVFSYATANGLYYPSQTLNPLSGLIDTLFNASYLTLGLAIVAYVLSIRAIAPAPISLALSSPAKVEFLVFVNPQGQILSCSHNFARLISSPATPEYVGTQFTDAVGLAVQDAQELRTKFAERAMLGNRPLVIRDRNGRSRSVALNCLSIYAEEHVDAMALVLCANPVPEGETTEPLSRKQKTLADHYLSQIQATTTDENRAIKEYFLEQMNLLYSLIRQISGTRAAADLLAHLSQVALQRHWAYSCRDHKITIPDEVEGQTLANLLREILRESRNFAADMTDGRMVEQEILSLDSSVKPETLRFIDRYDLRHAVWRSA